MGIAPDDNVAGGPQALFDDDVMKAARARIEDVADAVLGGEAAGFGEHAGFVFGGRGEGVVEDEGDALGIEDRAAAHFLFEDFGDEVGAEIVQHHAIHPRHDDVAGRDLGPTAGLGQDFLDHVHRGRPW